MQYIMRICNDVIVNMYLAESIRQNLNVHKKKNYGLQVKYDWPKPNE